MMAEQVLEQASPSILTAVAGRGGEAVPAPTALQAAAVTAIGILSSVVVVVQPVVLGPLAAEGRLTLREIGQTAMCESLGIAVAVALAGIFLQPRRLKLIVVLAVLASTLANIVSAMGSHEVIALARLVNGLTVGVILWVWTGLLTRIALPGRNVAIFVAMQSSLGLALSWLLSNVIVERVGGSGAYAVMAGLGLVNVLLALAIPSRYPTDREEAIRHFQVPSPRGLAGLLSVLAFPGGVMAVWVYALPLGEQMGLAPAFVATCVSVGLGGQIAGGLAGAASARMTAERGLYISVAGSLVAVALIAWGGSPATFMGGLALLAFFMMFAPSFQMPYLLQIDPGRGAGMQMVSAAQLGYSVGPALAAWSIHGGRVGSAFVVSAVLYALSGIVVFATVRRPVAE